MPVRSRFTCSELSSIFSSLDSSTLTNGPKVDQIEVGQKCQQVLACYLITMPHIQTRQNIFIFFN